MSDLKQTKSIEDWNKIITNNPIVNSIREIILNRNQKPVYKLGTHIHHTCMPNGEVINYQFD